MPLYEYRCSDCGHQFDMLRPMSEADEPAVCRACNNGAQRVLSVFASFSSTGDEWSRSSNGWCRRGVRGLWPCRMRLRPLDGLTLPLHPHPPAHPPPDSHAYQQQCLPYRHQRHEQRRIPEERLWEHRD